MSGGRRVRVAAAVGGADEEQQGADDGGDDERDGADVHVMTSRTCTLNCHSRSRLEVVATSWPV
jgi:hypothetical protein